jgi:hypothetical protein
VARAERSAFESERERLASLLYQTEIAPPPQLIAQLAN